MKIVVIGDIHGRAVWKAIVINETFEKVIFIGDYFDSREGISCRQQIDNFKDIITYKRDNMDKVVLLFGNHDFHYTASAGEKYSNYQFNNSSEIRELVHKAIDENLVQMCFTQQNFLFSHAGVTKTWVKNNLDINDMNIEDGINGLFKTNPGSFRFTVGKNRSPYGDDVDQSPIWVRPDSLVSDRIDGYVQVVGHTTQDQIKIDEGVVLIDCLGTSGQYLIIENGEIRSSSSSK